MKYAIQAIILALLLLPINTTKSLAESELTQGLSCEQVWNKYGFCVGSELAGKKCRKEDDFAVPERCREAAESEKWLKAGMREAMGEKTSTTHSQTIKEGYPMCMSEELLDQLVTASNNKDQRGMEYLLSNGCVAARGGIEISVLDRTWTGKVKIRAYANDQAYTLWTLREAIQE
jgi:hypothetical protein